MVPSQPAVSVSCISAPCLVECEGFLDELALVLGYLSVWRMRLFLKNRFGEELWSSLENNLTSVGYPNSVAIEVTDILAHPSPADTCFADRRVVCFGAV